MAEREACLWLKAGANTGPVRRGMVWDESKRMYVKAVGFDGQPRMERLPQVGFHGQDITNLRAMKLEERAVLVLNMNGDEVRRNLTPAGAAKATEDDHFRMRRDNDRKGWIYVGSCPVRDAQAGRLNRAKLISPECGPGAAMCDESVLGKDPDGRLMPPCPHYLAEKKARLAAALGRVHRQIDAHKDAEAKQLDAIRDGAEANREQAAAIRELAVHLAGTKAETQEKSKR